MDDYLAKPIELFRLMQKLAQWLPIPALCHLETLPVDAALPAGISNAKVAVAADMPRPFRRFGTATA
jgi:hypothetical protein